MEGIHGLYYLLCPPSVVVFFGYNPLILQLVFEKMSPSAGREWLGPSYRTAGLKPLPWVGLADVNSWNQKREGLEPFQDDLRAGGDARVEAVEPRHTEGRVQWD